MRQRSLLLITAIAFSSLGISGGVTHAADVLEKGAEVQDFELKGSDGKDYKLSSFRDKQAVVIAWYPKAFTGG